MPTAELILPYLHRIDDSGWFTNFGPLVRGLEDRLAARFGPATSVVTVANATVGLAVALRALDLPERSLCALPSWTFAATAHAVCQAGLTPFFVDVDEETAALDPDAVREQIASAGTPVRAVIVVSPFGSPLDTTAWGRFREETGIPVIVDAAAQFDTACDAHLPHVVSLHATKVLGIGEGGYVASEDPKFCERVRAITNFGFRGSREVTCPAGNGKLSEYAAAVGHVALDLWPQSRLKYRSVALKMRALLFDQPSIEFQKGWGDSWVTSVCSLRLPSGTANGVEAGLLRLGIESRRWWGRGCHREGPFAAFPRTALPVTEKLAADTLGAPYFAGMADGDISRVTAGLVRALTDARR